MEDLIEALKSFDPKTLRDEFAMAALQGLLAGTANYVEISHNQHVRPEKAAAISPGHEAAAIIAYEYADSMLSARKEQP